MAQVWALKVVSGPSGQVRGLLDRHLGLGKQCEAWVAQVNDITLAWTCSCFLVFLVGFLVFKRNWQYLLFFPTFPKAKSPFFPSEQLSTPNLLGGPVTGREAAKSTTAQDLVMDLANPPFGPWAIKGWYGCLLRRTEPHISWVLARLSRLRLEIETLQREKRGDGIIVLHCSWHSWLTKCCQAETPRSSCKLRCFFLWPKMHPAGLQHFCSVHWMDRDCTQPTVVEPLYAVAVMELN